MAFPDKNYTLGVGKVFFDKGNATTKASLGLGQRYFGNTPEFNVTSESEVLDHYDSDGGVKSKDDSVLLNLNRTGTFITDHISPENLALFYLGENSVLVQAGAVGETFLITDAKRDVRYQIGADAANPAGARGIENVVVEVGVSTKVLNTDYTLDTATGGIVFLSTGSIADLAEVDITYDLDAVSYNYVVSAAAAAVYGSLYFESTAVKGEKFDHFYPWVAIRPDGDFALKSGDEWQQLGFSVEILKKDDETESVYIMGRPGSGV